MDAEQEMKNQSFIEILVKESYPEKKTKFPGKEDLQHLKKSLPWSCDEYVTKLTDMQRFSRNQMERVILLRKFVFHSSVSLKLLKVKTVSVKLIKDVQLASQNISFIKSLIF